MADDKPLRVLGGKPWNRPDQRQEPPTHQPHRHPKGELTHG